MRFTNDINLTISLQLQQWLTNELKGEITELEMDLLLEGKILDEIIEEQYQWYVSPLIIIGKMLCLCDLPLQCIVS